MAELSDNLLKNLNERLSEMDKQLARGIQLTQTIGQEFKSAFSGVEIASFMTKLKELDRTKGRKIDILFNLVDDKGRPLDAQTLKDKIKHLSKSISRGDESYGKLSSRQAMTDQLALWKEQLRMVSKGSVEQMDLLANAIRVVNQEQERLNRAKEQQIQKEERILELEIRQEERERVKNERAQQKLQEKEALSQQRQQALEEKRLRQERLAQSKAALREQARVEKEAVANMKRQIEIKQQLAKIDHDRQIRSKQGVGVDKSQIDAERQSYAALQRELTQLIAKQKELNKISGGSATKKARSTMGTFSATSNAREVERYQKALKKLEEQEKRNIKRQEELEKRFKQTGDTSRTLTSTLSRLAGALGLTFGLRGVTSFVKKIAETRGEFEMLQVSLRSILGNKEKADEIWSKTLQMALESPYTAQQLAKSTKQLAAFRIETHKLYDTTKMLADVAAGLGVDQERLNLAYGHTKASGFLRGMYARQFATAGVNIYGELAEYYSKAEKKLISFSEVYERISKKQVKFEDVEAVFKKLTSEGGAFYNMQLNMTNTLQGQINKLKDAYAQLLNKIGKQNEGALKGGVNILLEMVRNWRAVLNVIEIVGGSAMMAVLMRFVSGLRMTGAAAALASREVVGLAAAGARTRVMFEGLGKTLKSHPILLIASAIAALGLTFFNMNKKFREMNSVLDEQSVIFLQSSLRMKKYNADIEENNQKIETLGKKQNKTKEETEELSKAQSDNIGMVAELRKNYPELADQLTITANGYISNYDALAKYNKELEANVTLLQLAKSDSMWKESLEKNAGELLSDLSRMQNEISQQKAVALLNIANLPEEEGAKHNRQVRDVLEEIANLDETDLNSIKKYNALVAKLYYTIEKLSDKVNSKEFNLGKNFVNLKYVNASLGAFFDAVPDFIKPNVDFSKGSKPEFITTAMEDVEKDLKRINPTIRSEMQKGLLGIKEYAEEIEKTDGGWTKWLENNIKRVNEDIVSGKYDPWKVVRTFLEKAGSALTPQMRQFYNQQLVKLQKFAPEGILAKLFNVFLTGGKNTTAGGIEDPNGNGAKAKDSISRLISLLKEMNSEYDKLSKSAYGYVAANDKVRESYREAFKEIFKAKYGTKGRYELDKAFTMINWDEVDTTNKQGVANAMKKLRDYMDANDIWKHYSKETRAEIEKFISGMEVGAEIQVHARIRDDFKREMEQMFSNYDLTLELQGLKINPQQAKDLFPDFEETTIGQLQDKLEEFYQKWNTKGEDGKSLFSEEDLEAYRQMSDKIASDVLKMQKEKAKEYSKYFERELSDRAKLEMKYAQDLAFVRANISDETQRSNIEANLGKKYAEDLHELEWKSFKESDFYVEMMDDISSLPATYTKLMMAKLNEILANPQTLSPRALKEAIKAREKIMQAQIDLQPISVMKESRERIREGAKAVGGKTWWGTRKNLDKEISANQELINQRNKEIQQLQTIQAKVKSYELAEEAVGVAQSKLSSETVKKIETEGSEIDALNAMRDEQAKNLERINELRKKQLSGTEALSTTERDELQGLEATTAALNTQIPILDEYIKKQDEATTVRQGLKGTTAETWIKQGKTSADVGQAINTTQENANQLEQTNAKLKDSRKAFDDYVKGLGSINQAMGHTIGKFKDLGNAWYDTYEALGGETDVLTDAWKEFGNTMVDTITRALEMIPTLVAGFVSAGTSINAALGIIGLIAEAIQLVITLVGALAKVHDAGYEKEIQAQQKAIDNLSRAYDRLEKQIDKTLHVSSYMRTFDDSLDNIQQQIQATEQQLQAERSKKNSDEDKIQEYENNIEDLYDKERELRQKMIEDMGGIGEDNYRSWAEGFVSAWKDAFLETGDGLDALQEHFDEFLQDWFVKQATMRIAGKALERVMGDIDNVVSDDGYVNWDELQRIRQQMALVLPELNERLSEFAGMWDLGGEGALSGLAAGIQGITEEQANILEAYWNSVRMYTASIDTNVAALATAFGVGTGVNTNPMLQQLTLTAQHTNDILLLLESVRTNNGSGNGIRVISV